MPAGKGDEIYFEFRIQGNVAKATAIEPKTGTEVSVVGPANASAREALRAAALQKLIYVLKKKRGEL